MTQHSLRWLRAAALATGLSATPALAQDTAFDARQEAYDAAAAGDHSAAFHAWARAWEETRSSSDALQALLSALRVDDTATARGWINRVDPAQLQRAEQAAYYEARARLADSPSQAADFFGMAAQAEDRAYRRFEQALRLDEAGRTGEALNAYAAARAQDPDNIEIILAEAYALRRAGRDSDAAALFERAIALDPSRRSVLEDQAYAYKSAGQDDDAREAFRSAVDLYPPESLDDPETLQRHYRIRREIETLERTHYGLAYLVYRDNAVAQPGLALPETAAPVSQLGGEYGWRPKALFSNGRGFTPFVRGFVSLEEDSLEIADETFQAGAGVQYKPFSEHNFNLTAERLLAVGDLARDAWLLRAAYGWSNGLDWRPATASWNYTTLYADLSYIPDDPEFFSAFASARQGRRYRIGEAVTITPYLTAVAQYSDDSLRDLDRFEFGGGAALSFWLDSDTYRAHRRRVDLELEYRLANDGNDDAAIARIVVSF